MPTRATRRRSPWRGPGLVDWSLYDDPEQTAAEAELDRAFVGTDSALGQRMLAARRLFLDEHPVQDLMEPIALGYRGQIGEGRELHRGLT